MTRESGIVGSPPFKLPCEECEHQVLFQEVLARYQRLRTCSVVFVRCRNMFDANSSESRPLSRQLFKQTTMHSIQGDFSGLKVYQTLQTQSRGRHQRCKTSCTALVTGVRNGHWQAVSVKGTKPNLESFDWPILKSRLDILSGKVLGPTNHKGQSLAELRSKFGYDVFKGGTLSMLFAGKHVIA